MLFPADWSNYFTRICESYISLTKLLYNIRDGGGVGWSPVFLFANRKKIKVVMLPTNRYITYLAGVNYSNNTQ